MKTKLSLITSLFLILSMSGCNFSYSESGREINLAKDAKELALAKKSLQFIEQGNIDSLNDLLSKDVLKKSNPEQLEWLYENGKRVIENNEYPNDSIITVSNTTRKSISGEEYFKELNFPFLNKSNPDSTMYFKITIADGEIHKLMLSTGRRFEKLK